MADETTSVIEPTATIPLTGYQVNGVDLFSSQTGPTAPTDANFTGYNMNGFNLFTRYNALQSNYMINLSNFNYIFRGTKFDIILYNYFTKATIGRPANAIFSKTNNRLCWKIINGTTVQFKFPNTTTMNFLAVGGGQIGGQEFGGGGINNSYGGYGGGVVIGKIEMINNLTLSVTIGISGTNTSITGTNINITANAGFSTGTGGSATGSSIVTSTPSLGGTGGIAGLNSDGGNGPFISDLGIYVAGGGGRPSSYPNTLKNGGKGGLGGWGMDILVSGQEEVSTLGVEEVLTDILVGQMSYMYIYIYIYKYIYNILEYIL